MPLYLALINQIGSVHDAERFTHIVVRNENRQPCAAQHADDLLNFAHGDGINAAERLVEHEQLGFGDQRAGDGEAALLPAGEGDGEVVRHVGDAELLHQRLALLIALLLGILLGFHHCDDVFAHRKAAENRFFLRQVAHAVAGADVHGLVGHIVPFENDLATIGPHQAHDHVKRGGLASPVGPEQADDFTGLHVDIHAIHHRAAVINLLQFAGIEQAFLGKSGVSPFFGGLVPHA